ncbi:hypothetical protein F5146DRAFT_1139093 [Armillaria mellea]|nr:hypothetical protein F5146DRAFT_1139093 [Armillaria mellea]
MDSDWDEDVTSDLHGGEAEWNKMSSEFINTGYREGITAGKEAALQEGFDAGFAQVGSPCIRFSDIAPRDIEAEEHAREHLEDSVSEPEEVEEKRKIEDLEDMLNRLSAGKSITADEGRPTLEDLQRLKDRLKALMERLSLEVERS